MGTTYTVTITTNEDGEGRNATERSGPALYGTMLDCVSGHRDHTPDGDPWALLATVIVMSTTWIDGDPPYDRDGKAWREFTDAADRFRIVTADAREAWVKDGEPAA